jgi:hypothetical protein
MKNQIFDRFSNTSAAALAFKSLLTTELPESLLPFYLGLDAEARRARFGAAVSDASIARHCRGLNVTRAIVLACEGLGGVVAAIELHALTPDWSDAELALTCTATSDQTTIVAHLAQLAAFAAGKRGCRALIISPCLHEQAFIEIFRGMGRATRQDDGVRIDISEYARLERRLNFLSWP